ncbi:hypothetical protein LINPERHAP1_LOCUS25895 [Linum perenne]
MAEPERKLNLNAPLLSVRRYSSPIRAAQVTKETTNAEDSKFDRRYSLPSFKIADCSSLEQQQVTEPVAVPFHWEQIPGRRKDGGSGNGGMLSDHPRGSSRFPVRWVPGIVKNQEDKKLNQKTTQIKSLDRMNGEVSTGVKSEGIDDDVDGEEDDDKYSDALESLSAMGSCSMKCSVSGVSSSDCLVVKPSGTFASDPQTRDFMMSRFLPAAKAMTLEQPQYSAKKQQHVVVVEQQSRQIVVKAAVNRPESAIVPYHPKEVEQEDSEEDCDDDEYEESVNLPMKACGLFPRLCFKNSICLFSPVPGMKVKSLPSFSSSSGKSNKPSKAASSRSSSPSTTKGSKDDARKQRPIRGVQSPRMMEVENRLASGSDSFNYAGDRQMSGRISPFSRRSGSPYRNSAPQSPFQGIGPHGLSKEAEIFMKKKPYLYCKGGSKSQELTPLYRTKQDSSNATGKELMVVPKTNAPDGNDAGPGVVASATSSELRIRDQVDMSNYEISGDQSKALVCVSGNSDASSLDGTVSMDSSTLPPLLPKMPSESWLWRTLPTVSSRSPFGGASSFRGKWVDSKASSTTSKWETMVKSSYMHHDHVRYSEVMHSTLCLFFTIYITSREKLMSDIVWGWFDSIDRNWYHILHSI